MDPDQGFPQGQGYTQEQVDIYQHLDQTRSQRVRAAMFPVKIKDNVAVENSLTCETMSSVAHHPRPAPSMDSIKRSVIVRIQTRDRVMSTFRMAQEWWVTWT